MVVDDDRVRKIFASNKKFLYITRRHKKFWCHAFQKKILPRVACGKLFVCQFKKFFYFLLEKIITSVNNFKKYFWLCFEKYLDTRGVTISFKKFLETGAAVSDIDVQPR